MRENMELVKLENPYFELISVIDEKVRPYKIADKLTGQIYADLDYRYHIRLRTNGQDLKCEELIYEKHSLKSDREGGRKLILEGALDFGRKGVQLKVRHKFWAPAEEPYFEERIVLRNCGELPCYIEDIEFGFRKSLCPVHGHLENGLDKFRLVAVPYRKQVDGREHDYSMTDILKGRFQNSDWM
ncbi:MAG: hypothetical protein DRJ51_05090, partial [Thermoprotei archaeon]